MKTTYYQQILDSISSGIFLLDDQFNILYMNESAEYLIQNSFSKAASQSFFGYVHDGNANQDSSNHLLAACRRCMNEKSKIWLHDVLLDFLIPRKQQRMDCQLRLLQSSKNHLLLLELVPIQETVPGNGNDRSLKVSQNVVRSLAHEIRNPLGGIRGSAQLLADELSDVSQNQYTDVIIREADRLSKLVTQMQASAEIKQMVEINVHSVLEHVRLLTLSSEAFNSARIETDYDPSLPNIIGDSDQLTQAILNMVQNANEACADNPLNRKGGIILRTRIDHQILIGNQQQEQVVRIDIEDNGNGIHPIILKQMFEPMVSSKRDGRGLGLSITDEIIRYHGGIILVKSEPGRTKFSLYLKIWGQ